MNHTPSIPKGDVAVYLSVELAAFILFWIFVWMAKEDEQRG